MARRNPRHCHIHMDAIKEISVFVDESGSFDATDLASRYYLVCMVFHDQSDDISKDIAKLEEGIGSSETSFKVITLPLSKVTDSPLVNFPKIGPGLSPNSKAFFLLKDLFFCFGIQI